VGAAPANAAENLMGRVQSDAPPAILVMLASPAGAAAQPERTALRTAHFATAYYLFRDAGFEVVVATPGGGQPAAAAGFGADDDGVVERFRRDARARDDFADTLRLDQVYAEDFEAAFVMAPATWRLTQDERAAGLIADLAAAGRPIALVGHAPELLCAACDPRGRPLAAGRHVTGATAEEEAANDRSAGTLEARLVRAGARYSCGPAWEPHAVADGPLITGQNLQSVRLAAELLLRALAGSDRQATPFYNA
jgi:putative intracellular protease/amidase